MAEQTGNRTEKATARRKAEARRKGQVALSRDVPTAAILFGAVGMFYLLSGTATSKLIEVMQTWLVRATEPGMRAALTADRFQWLLGAFAWDAVALSLPFAAGIAVIGSAAYVLQTGWMWNSESLQMDPSRISLAAGLRRLGSLRTVAEFVKALLKVVIIGGAGYLAVTKDLSRLPELVQYDLATTLHFAGAVVFRLSLLIAMTVGLIAIADYGYQRFEWERSLKMSRQEVKQEHREAEGDPMLKSRVRTIQRDMARSRMMAAVPKADVVITNPTHFAVALQYDQDAMAAPIVVAKGAGYVAERIKQIAAEHGVMVVENKVVARSLFQLVDIGREVPVELYKAVAEILALVYRARGQGVA